MGNENKHECNCGVEVKPIESFAIMAIGDMTGSQLVCKEEPVRKLESDYTSQQSRIDELQEKLNDLNSMTEDQVSYLKVLSEKETEILSLQEKLKVAEEALKDIHDCDTYYHEERLVDIDKIARSALSTIKGETE